MDYKMLLTLLTNAFADTSFARLFSEMSPWVIALFIVGIVFCMIELLIPGFGFFGISGLSMIVIAIVLRMIMGGDALMLLYMLLLAAVLFALLFWLLGSFIRKRQADPKSLFYVKPAVSETITAGTRDYTDLVGKKGVATTILRPIGRAEIDGKPIDVVSRDGFMDAGTAVVVVSVEGQTVTVVKAD